jgi:short-subunit dehydrogenase
MICVITGATKGIGRATTLMLAPIATGLALCARNEADLTALQAELSARHPELPVYTCVADMADREQVEDFSEGVREAFGEVNVAVLNAGIFLPGGIATEADGTLEKLWAVNVAGPYHLIRAILPMIQKQANTGALVVMIGSTASETAYPNGGAYGMTKHAVLGMAKNLREEMKPLGVRVTCIMPGATYTASWEEMDIDPERLMPAEDVARAVLFAVQSSPRTVVEEILMRPQLGDLA